MAFSDLCHISNAYKAVDNEPDQSERIMEENSMVRDLITKILDETGPADGNSSIQPPEKTVNGLTNQHPKNDIGPPYNMPPNFSYQNNMYNFTQNDQSSFNNFNIQNGFGNNGFVNYNNNDVTALLGVDTLDTSAEVTPEQLNLLRLAAQEIGGAQFTNTNTNKYDDKFYNFYEQNQRNSLQENNMFAHNFNRPNSLNLDMTFNGNFNEHPYNNMQRFPSKFDNSFIKDTNQDTSEVLTYLNNLNISLERQNDTTIPNNMEFKLPMEMNGHYQNDDVKVLDERNKMLFNRNFPPPKGYNGENYFINDMNDRNPANPNQINQNFDFTQPPNSMNFKPNGFHQSEYMRRDMNQPMMRENFPTNGSIEQRNFENAVNRDAAGMQQAALIRQNQELTRQMSLLMMNRPPPNQLNVDVSFLRENTPFNLGLGGLMAPSAVAPPPVLPSPLLDLPLLMPFYTMRNMRGAVTSSGILHARLDACYEQWRQLERERKRTEARLALAYPGRAVSSSNSIPVPRLPPCPTRVDRLTVDMLREHTKVLTLMGKMETLRASVSVAQNKKPFKPEETPRASVCVAQNKKPSKPEETPRASVCVAQNKKPSKPEETPRASVCVAQNKKPSKPEETPRASVCVAQNKKPSKPEETPRASVCVAQNKKPSKPEENKITLLKRGQENIATEKDKENGFNPATFDPSNWREDVKNLTEIAPHSEVESAMLAWRAAVAAVQAARRRELAPHAAPGCRRPADPILQLADAVKQLCIMARRARCAMWCDLTLTVALAHQQEPVNTTANTAQNETQSTRVTPPKSNTAQTPSNALKITSASLSSNSKASSSNIKAPREKSTNTTKTTSTATKNDPKTENNNPASSSNNNKSNLNNKQDKTTDKNRRTQNYRKLNQGRNDFYQKNQRSDNRFMHGHPYYLATGPIN